MTTERDQERNAAPKPCKSCAGSGLVDRYVRGTTLGGGHLRQEVCLCRFGWGPK